VRTEPSDMVSAGAHGLKAEWSPLAPPAGSFPLCLRISRKPTSLYTTHKLPVSLAHLARITSSSIYIHCIPVQSFAVSLNERSMEWSSNGMGAVFATPSNAVSPKFYSFLKDMLRFNVYVAMRCSGAGALL